LSRCRLKIVYGLSLLLFFFGVAAISPPQVTVRAMTRPISLSTKIMITDETMNRSTQTRTT
jgi:hypothetical protein